VSGWTDLVDALGLAPSLDGALCRGRSTAFDEPPPEADEDVAIDLVVAAMVICDRCPAREACTRWLEGLAPTQRPAGVVAGRVTAPELAQTPPRRIARPDLAEAVDAALRSDPRVSDSEHARRIGCAGTTVTAARRRLEAARSIPRVQRVAGGPR